RPAPLPQSPAGDESKTPLRRCRARFPSPRTACGGAPTRKLPLPARSAPPPARPLRAEAARLRGAPTPNPSPPRRVCPRGWRPARPRDVIASIRTGSTSGSELSDVDPADVLRVAECDLLELRIDGRAGVGEDRRLQPVLARVECRLHDASLGGRADDHDALDRLALEQQLERRV